MLKLQMQLHQIKDPIEEYRFIKEELGSKGIRKKCKELGLKDWRFDFAWIDEKIAVEVQGGMFIYGRHTRGGALKSEYSKLNEAQLRGWIVLVVDDSAISQKRAVLWIEKALQQREGMMQ